MEYIKIAIGWLLNFIYGFVDNYGVAVILFTLVIKILLLPLGLKQQKSMTAMQMVQPKLKEIQERYKNDQNLLSQETMKLYKEYKISPMGGCLPLLLQLPILFALYRVLYQPLTYMLGMDANEIANLAVQAKGTMKQITMAKANGLLDFGFFGGLDLAKVPSFKEWFTLIIPALAGITTYLSSKLSQWISKNKNDKPQEEKKPQRILNPEAKDPNAGAGSAEGMGKTMSVIMPIFTVWITYTLPMAMGLYWIASNVFSMGQTVLLNGYYSKKLKAQFEERENQRVAKQASIHGKKKRGN